MKEHVEDILTAPESALVCYCGQVTKAKVRQMINDGVTDLTELKKRCGSFGDACERISPRGRCCTPEFVKLLKQISRSPLV